MPTLLMDEGDIKDSDEAQELIKLLNLGFEDGNRMFNCDKNDPSKIEFFNPYCPKVITRRRQFKDQATEARCLTEVMRQTTRKDIPALLTSAFHKKQAELRNKLLKFRFDYYHKINIDNSSEIDLGDVEPRIKQATLAFTTLLSNSPEALESFKLFIKEYNAQIIDNRAGSYDGQIVNAIIDLICLEHKQISSQDILEHSSIKATAATIGRHLGQLKIETKVTKIDGATRRIIQLNSDFFDVCKRYCSDQDKLKKVSEVSGVSGISADTLTKFQNEANHSNTPINKKSEVCSNVAETAETAETKKGVCGKYDENNLDMCTEEKLEDSETFFELPADKKDWGKCGYCNKISYLLFKDQEGNHLCETCYKQEVKK